MTPTYSRHPRRKGILARLTDSQLIHGLNTPTDIQLSNTGRAIVATIIVLALYFLVHSDGYDEGYRKAQAKYAPDSFQEVPLR